MITVEIDWETIEQALNSSGLLPSNFVVGERCLEYYERKSPKSKKIERKHQVFTDYDTIVFSGYQDYLDDL